MIGKVEMTNRVRKPVAPGLALIGDAALATDPLFGVGCGWAFQSAEWLADSVAPALHGEESLEQGLERYRRRHGRELGGHAFLIHDYASGRASTPPERLMFSAAARDPKIGRDLRHASRPGRSGPQQDDGADAARGRSPSTPGTRSRAG